MFLRIIQKQHARFSKKVEKAEETSEAENVEDPLKDHLRALAEVKQPPRVTFEELVTKSKTFVVPFPIDTARASTLQKGGHEKSKLEEHINSAYPLIHENVLPLLANFLRHKRIHGRKKERKLYSSMDLLGLVDRLLKKRPVVFFSETDIYVLRDGTIGNGTIGSEKWEDIGHSSERAGLTIKKYMSYDEIKLSALMCISSRSVFINNGSRDNRGVPGAPGTFQSEGVIVGMVGARFERSGFMEWQDIVVTPDQNTQENGYGQSPPPRQGLVQEWGRFWKTELPTWEQVQNSPDGSYLTLSPKIMFNINVYKSRIQLSAETLIAEAGIRATAVGLRAYVHVVGLGLGVWQITSRQNQLFVEAWGEALKVSDTTHIAHVDFSYFTVDKCFDTGDGEVFPGTDVTLHFSNRALHALVPSDTLLVTSFAWDGNSLPGNEYWKGKLSASGDPAAACSSSVAELHNALINPCITAENLHIASTSGVEHVSQYAKRKLEQS